MITADKVKIYSLFNGDHDGWARSRTQKEKSVMNDHDWFLIETFIQDVGLIKKGLASTFFINAINEKLKEACDSEETIQAIKNCVL